MPPPLPNDDNEDVDVDFPDVADEDSDGLDMIPAKAPKANGKQKIVEDKDEDEEEEEAGAEEDDEEAEIFAVEKILKHDFSEKGVVLYRVKWLGYEKASDQTWEPEMNLTEGAADILEAYHKKIGGRPTQDTKATPASGKKGRGKRQASEDSPAPVSGRKKMKTFNGDKSLPTGDWEVLLHTINTIDEAPAAAGSGKKSTYRVFTTFKDGSKATLPMSVIRERCPQKLIDYYEQHLTFRETQVAVDEDDDDNEDGVSVQQEVPKKTGRPRGRAKK